MGLKFGDRFFTSLTMLRFESKPLSTLKSKKRLSESALQRNAACNRVISVSKKALKWTYLTIKETNFSCNV